MWTTHLSCKLKKLIFSRSSLRITSSPGILSSTLTHKVCLFQWRSRTLGIMPNIVGFPEVASVSQSRLFFLLTLQSLPLLPFKVEASFWLSSRKAHNTLSKSGTGLDSCFFALFIFYFVISIMLQHWKWASVGIQLKIINDSVNHKRPFTTFLNN